MSFKSDHALVQSSCVKAGGIVVSKFSQCLQPVDRVVKMFTPKHQKHIDNGVCMALSNKWIIDHAADSSMWNTLTTSGGQAVNLAVLANIMIQFIDGVSYRSGQDDHAEKLLAIYGIIRRKDIVSKGRFWSKVGNKAKPDKALGEHLGQALVANMKNAPGGCYRHIGIYGTNGAHAMCAWIGKDVAFFDPNFGEYYFADSAAFVGWFPTFIKHAGYNKEYGYFDLQDYAKKAGGGKKRA
jgi:hypothetical protein